MPEYRLTRLRGEWAAAVWSGGKRLHRITLGTSDRKAAEVAFARFVAEYTRPKNLTVAYLWQTYRDENAQKRIAANMEYSGKSVLPFFGHFRPDEITLARCRAYIALRRKAGRKPGTAWTELNHLQTVINWAAKRHIIPHTVAIEKPQKPAPRDRRLTWAEGKRLLEAARSPHITLAIALMLGTAARIGAILELTWDRVDLERGMVAYTNPEATGRRKGRATVPMPPDLKERLREARRGAVTEFVVEWAGRNIASIKRGFARAVKDAGLVDVTPHVLRHTAASWMAERGIPMPQIAAVLGHSDSRLTERIYAKFSPEYLRAAVAALDMSGVPSGGDEPAP